LAKINQDLIDRIADHMGITPKAVYRHIQKIVHDTALERDLAALVLAMRNRININRFSTAGQRADIRRAIRGGASDLDDEPRERRPAEPSRRPTKAAKKKTKKTKGNTVFVVHGRDDVLRRSMFDFLRALHLHPLEWDHAIDEAKEGNPYVGHVLDVVMEKAEAIIVLFSPDDLAQLKDQFVKAGERLSEASRKARPAPTCCSKPAWRSEHTRLRPSWSRSGA
jgi:hypothetical protein